MTDSFRALLEAHGPALQRLAGGYELDPERRAELYQEILLALWRALPTHRGDASLRTFAFRVAHNVAITHVHRATRTVRGTDAVDGVPVEPELDRALDQDRITRRLRAAIAALPPVDRQLALLLLEEVPQAEIAEITGLSVTNVSTRVYRLKKKLAQLLTAPEARHAG